MTATERPAPPAAAAPRPPRHRLVLAAALLAITGAALFVNFAFQVRALVARRATGPAWAFPSQVWSADLPLVPGTALPLSRLREELTVRGYREVPRSPAAPGEWRQAPYGADVWTRGARAVSGASPDPLRVRLRLGGGWLLDVTPSGLAGSGAGKAALEPVLLAQITDSNRVIREYVPLARIPKALQDAVITSEDRRFRSHWGLDLRGNARALAANVRAGGVRQGASTITQQLARGLFLGSRRTFTRKLAELPIAIGLEMLLRKDQILEMYLNSVYFGRDDAGSFAGVAEASRRFFGVPVESLTTGQSALLAGVIPAPNLYSPLRRPDNALRRRAIVLRGLLETGRLDSSAVRAAAAEPLRLHPQLPPAERFPSYVAYVRQSLGRTLPPGALTGWGLQVVSACDPVAQHEAEVALAAGVDAQAGWRGRSWGPLQGAFVLLESATGEVRALVGGRDPGRGDFNRATQALRQPGSAIKPIVYATALDATRPGARFTPGSTLPDLRREFATPEGPWKPRNDEGDYHDSVTLAKALAKSLNLATANLVERIGAGTVARYAERFGLGHPAAVASIGLGTHEVTPLALVDAYSVFPNGGWRREPTPVRAVFDGLGRPLALPQRPQVRVLPPAAASLARGLLEDVVTFGISYPLRAEYGFLRPCGGKTGTTNDYHDAWFVGFTPELTAGVWIGYDHPQSLARPAAKVALPVWAGVLSRVLADFPETNFPISRDETLAWIDPWTGGLARPDCPSPMRVPFLRGTEPTTPCARDHAADWEALRARALADSLAAPDSTAADTLGIPTDPEEH